MTHYCHAKDCKAICKPEFLMCPRHWRMVPRGIQTLVWKHYRLGQCIDKRPSEAWHAAADLAIASVARLENKISESNYEAIRDRSTEVLIKQVARTLT